MPRAAFSTPGRLFPHADKPNAAKDRNLLILQSDLSAKGAGNVWASSEAVDGKTVAHFRKRLWPASDSVQSGVALDPPGPERGTIQKQRQAGPTQALKRTADALSPGGGRARDVAVSRLGW